VARLGELEEGHLKRKQTRSRKHTIKVRRRDTPLLTGKRKLEALDIPGLHDQCYLRSMTTWKKGWQQLSRAELVKMCLKHKTRTAFLPGQDSGDDVTTDSAWSDTIDAEESDDDDSESEDHRSVIATDVDDDDHSD
jgi:hypothetical protein